MKGAERSRGGSVGLARALETGRLRGSRRWLPQTGWCLAGAIMALAMGYLLMPSVPLYPPELGFSGAVADRDGRVIHLALAPDGRYRLRASLKEISPHLIAATLHHEDRHFYLHPGINPASLWRAAWGAMRGKRSGGASTITMQLARLRFCIDTRSALGKLKQMLRALQIERHYTKSEILEAYFNLAPYGANVEGAAAAALLWCGRPVGEIGEREAAALAVLPQSPARRRPRHGEPNAALAAAQHRLRRSMGAGREDPLDAAFSLMPPGPVPREVPHLARRLLSGGRGGTIRTTIHRQSQRALERAIDGFLATRRGEGIQNACALLVDAASREVLGYVGSAGFLDESIQGQVDGIRARRSPGSALKPFVYALAIDQGLIHPGTLLKDSPASFGEYDPENFDRAFSGPISAAEALYHSRNVPAVFLASRLRGAGLYGFLKAAGVNLPKQEIHYGLSLPLGGGEISVEEMARIYALLADDGIARPLKYLIEGGSNRVEQWGGEELLSREARFLTLQMLRPPTDEPEVWPGGRLSWKTGTSHGFRDAWAAGVLGRLVLVVWVGNFDGRPNPALVARETAAPLLLECMRELPLGVRSGEEKAPPPGVVEVELCAVSGALPTPHCAHRRCGWFIPGVSPINPCAVHREILVDVRTGWRVASDDGERQLRREVCEFWPPDLLELFRQAGLPRREPPPLEPSARALAAASMNEAPSITSPREALVYALRTGDPEKTRIALEAECAPGTRRLFWFADGRIIGDAAPGTPLLWRPAPGEPVLHVIDDQGRSSSRRVRVELVD